MLYRQNNREGTIDFFEKILRFGWFWRKNQWGGMFVHYTYIGCSFGWHALRGGFANPLDQNSILEFVGGISLMGKPYAFC